jgi:hypothetical protein
VLLVNQDRQRLFVTPWVQGLKSSVFIPGDLVICPGFSAQLKTNRYHAIYQLV